MRTTLKILCATWLACACLVIPAAAQGAAAPDQAAPGQAGTEDAAGEEGLADAVDSAAGEATEAAAEIAVEPAVEPDDGPVAVPQASEETLSYYKSGMWVWVMNYLSVILVSVIILFAGLSPKMRDIGYRIGKYWPLAVVVYLVLFVAIDFVITFPFGYYDEVIRDGQYGLTDQTFGGFLVESLTVLPLAVVVISVLMIAIYFFLKKTPKYAWLLAGLIVFPFQFLNDAELWMAPEQVPLASEQLSQELNELGRRAGFDEVNVVQVAGDDIEVRGYFGTPTLRIGKEAEEALTTSQIHFLAARELGQRRLHHSIKQNLLKAVLAVFSFWLLFKICTALIARFKDRWGFDELSDIASWPLLPALFSVCFLLVQPFDAGLIRHNHLQADRFALELTHENRVAAQLLVEESANSLRNPDPGPIFVLWRGFRPPLAPRIEMINNHKPWETGEPLEFGDLIEPPASSV